MHNTQVKIQTWPEIADEARAANPLLADLVDQLDPDDSLDFVKISYLYGQHILHDGVFQIPLATGELVPITDSRISTSIKNKLNDHNMPAGLLLNKNTELYYKASKHIIPLQIFNKGDFIGLDEMLEPSLNVMSQRHRNISSGARTLFMLPKLFDQKSHFKLENYYKKNMYRPSNITEHYYAFKAIANSPMIENKWTNDILFFNKSWWDTKNLKRTKDIRNFLLQKSWQQSLNSKRAMLSDITWTFFVDTNKRILNKQSPIVIDAIKNLLNIQQGIHPGYTPAINDNSGPIDLLEQAYMECYKIRLYPTIMEPKHLNKATESVYYSLHLSFLNNNQSTGVYKENSTLDFCDLVLLMDALVLTYPDELSDKFLFFQPESNPVAEIKSLRELVESDKRLLSKKLISSGLNFAYSSSFLKSCIQIKS